MATVIRAWTACYVFCDLRNKLHSEHETLHQLATIRICFARTQANTDVTQYANQKPEVFNVIQNVIL